jgi:ATP-dependent protease ClpP protease subunit
MSLSRIFGAFLLVLTASNFAHAAAITSIVSQEGKAVILLNGDIEAGDAEKVHGLIRAANNSNRLVSGIRLNSKGGLLLEGTKLADVIRVAQIATVVPNGKLCASACFIAFAAGTQKFVSRTAQVGVHGASDKNGAESVVSNAATISMARIVKDLGVPPHIIGKMVITPPSEMVWLNENELRSMGAELTGKPAQTQPGAAIGGPLVALPLTQTKQATAQVDINTEWNTFVSRSIEISSQQNNGKANLSRICQPEHKLCSTAVFYNNKDGLMIMIRRNENTKGVLISRDICNFNLHKDVRTCVNWDSKISTVSMKDKNSEWISVD